MSAMAQRAELATADSFEAAVFTTDSPASSYRANDASIQDRGTSAVLTFWPSEFSQIRTQYRRTRYGDGGRVANELLFQALFTIGAHGAHPF